MSSFPMGKMMARMMTRRLVKAFRMRTSRSTRSERRICEYKQKGRHTHKRVVIQTKRRRTNKGVVTRARSRRV